MSGDNRELVGLVAKFESASALYHAAEDVRTEGYTAFDCYSPFPVHGIERAMGIKRTKLPYFVFFCGLLGCLGGYLLQWYTNAYDYAFMISGKPFNSVQADIPVIFESTVLLSAFGALFGMLWLNGLPRLYHPLFRVPMFRSVTTDGFMIYMESRDKRFDPSRTRSFLEGIGAVAIEDVYE